MCVQALSTASLNIPALGYQAGGQLVLTDGGGGGWWWWMVDCGGGRKKSSLISLKLGTLVVHDI